jgi:hypothetical protein
MATKNISGVLTQEVLQKLFPADKADQFFDALYGDASDGAYDISLEFSDYNEHNKELRLEFQLHERPGKCLACNLTYGLPEVFSRHPILNVKGLVGKIAETAGMQVNNWSLGMTSSVSKNLHTIPLILNLA